MSFFSRFPAGEFAPLFRLLDDYATHTTSRSFGPSLSGVRSFQPRVDVKEMKDAYEVQAELPGIDQKDINIEFTDATTLSIKGRTERSREEGTRPSNLIEGQADQARITEGENGYNKASVEAEATVSGAVPAKTTVAENEMIPTEQDKTDSSTYWFSERSLGEFHRSFSFPNRVDQDNVKASLKNGILSILVPKAAAPGAKRITIE